MYINEYFKTPIWSEEKPEFVKSLNKASDKYIKDKIRFALSIKPKKHDFLITPNSKPYMKRHMNVTGG